MFCIGFTYGFDYTVEKILGDYELIKKNERRIGRCCNYNYKKCPYHYKDITKCGVGCVRLLRNEGQKKLKMKLKGASCPYNEFSKYKVPDWSDEI